MPTKERKYKGSLTLAALELNCEAEEESYGHIVKLEALDGWSVATYDDADFPPLSSLALLTTMGDMPAPAQSHATKLFDGRATVLGTEMPISVFRVN